MLLVKGDEGWATIDLGALARAVAVSGEDDEKDPF